MPTFLLLLFLHVLPFFAKTPPPKPYGPTPSARQLQWHEMKYYAFIHFNMNTFTDFEWGHGTESPDTFNPTQLDCRQWARVCREAGMEGVIITAKHHDGFCLWPSKYTTHSVKNSRWRNGQGDVLKELAAACKEYGLKFGVYLSPWDRNHPQYGTPAYNEIFKNTLREVLTQYGEVFEVWFDGANGEGPNGKKQVYDWPGFIQTVRQYQPNAVIFSDAGPDIRWVGNEQGYGGETNWSTLNRDKVYPGYLEYHELTPGHEDGTHWVPAEVNCSIRPGWYYHAHEDDKVKSLAHLVDIYYSSVGRNGNWLLNLPVDRRGLVHENDVKQLMALKAYTDQAFAVNLAAGQPATATNVRGQDPTYAANAVLDNQKNTYWATDDGVTQATLEIDLGRPTAFNCLLLQEYIALGQRVQRFTVEAGDGGRYQPVAAGTTIGNRRLLRFPVTTARKVRITIDQAKASPVISNVALYRTPELLVDPVIRRTKAGMVGIVCPKTTDPVITYTLDGTEPTAQSPRFTNPFPLPAGGVVKARAFINDKQQSSSPVTALFDVSAAKWRVIIADTATIKAEKALDGDATTFWQTTIPEKDKGMPSVTVDLGESLLLRGFTYLPRQDNKTAGIIYRYALYASPDGTNWGQPISEGAFANIRNQPARQTIRFPKPQTARYVKLVALEPATPPTGTITVAELGILTK